MFFVVFCIIGLVAGILGMVLYFNVSNIFGGTMTAIELSKMKIMMLILTFNLAMNFTFSIYSSILTAYEKFTFRKILAIGSTIIKPLIMIPLLFLGFKSVTLAVVITIVNMFVLLLNYTYCKKKIGIKIKFSGFDKIIFKEILGYSFFIFLGELVDKANWSVDNFVLGSVSGTIAVSVYSVASHLNKMFVNLSTAISGVMLPKMSKMVAKNASPEILTKELIKVGRIQYFIIFLMASGLVLFGKNFIKLWAGNEFEESYYVALILIISVCFPLIQNLGLSIMQAMNKHKFRAVATSIMSVFNVVISVFLAKRYGATGAAIGTAIALMVCNVFIINCYYYKVIKLNVLKFWKEIFLLTMKFIIPIVIILVLMLFIKLNGWYQFIVFGSIYTILYLVFAYFFCFNKYEKDIADNLLIKLKIKKKKVQGM